MKRLPVRKHPARQKPPALERIDGRFAADDDGSNAEIIRLLRKAMFADVDELEASGAVRLPEPSLSSHSDCITARPKLSSEPTDGRDVRAERQLRPTIEGMIP